MDDRSALEAFQRELRLIVKEGNPDGLSGLDLLSESLERVRAVLEEAEADREVYQLVVALLLGGFTDLPAATQAGIRQRCEQALGVETRSIH